MNHLYKVNQGKAPIWTDKSTYELDQLIGTLDFNEIVFVMNPNNIHIDYPIRIQCISKYGIGFINSVYLKKICEKI